MKTSRVMLYDEPSVPEIGIDKLSDFIRDTFKVPTVKKDSIFYSCSDIIHDIAASRIRELNSPFCRHEPTAEEIEFERGNTADTAINSNITCYDGFELQNALGRIIPNEHLTDDTFHIIFTNKLTCTYDHGDHRYHGRALIGSNPSIISTTGIIEAPAKPREYYMQLITHSRLGINVESLQDKFRGTFLEYHDPRLAQIVCGYVLQAVFYYETQEAFCESVDCRLYNAHWQKDLLHSQIEVGSLCERHQEILDNLTT